MRRLLSTGGDVRDLKGLKLAAIGPATADKLKAYYLSADCQPATHTAEGLLEALTKTGRLKGQRFLIPRAAEARDVLPNGLREAGAEVVEVHAYKTVMADPPDADVLARLSQGQVDFVTFASSSTVRNFVTLVGANLPKHVRYASIGPITTQTAKDLGIEISVEAKEITIPGLVRAIVEAVH
ncbi:MAG: uroporphyrinogen-III synthase [Planctomycetes bacterium]|nr:uroporphyrinogen-III synthase [Planctomycetota bacterium]